jgi:hypothetical protein
VVNDQIGDYDIFVGVLWKRMGTPTTVAPSGTREEFDRAYEHWKTKKTLPILFYFCQQPFSPPRTSDEVEQLGQVVEFRRELSNKGLVATYGDHDAFADMVRPHLLLALGKMLSPQSFSAETSERMAQATSPEVDLALRRQIAELAQEYENIRTDMPYSDVRTRRMEDVVSRMRALALGGSQVLPELTNSFSAGQRLAAVIILESIPHPDYLMWLAQRLRAETAFVGYHAALALLAAVRALKDAHGPQRLQEALAIAKTGLEETGAKDSDRYRVLDEADRESRQ